jgi:hypothetical protein
MSKNELFKLMWKLVYCESVTVEAKKYLGDFLPSNFPVNDGNFQIN